MDQIGIIQINTGRNNKGTIGDKAEKITPIGPKQGKQTGTGGLSTGDINTGSIMPNIKDDIKTLKKDKEAKVDKKQKSKDKLKQRGYHENPHGKMVGKTPIDIGELSGEIDVDIIMQSSGGTIISGDTSNTIEVELPEGIFIYTQDGELYNGILDIPRLIDQENIDIKNFQAFKTVQILPDHPDLFFKDIDNNPVYVTIKIPTPDIPIGKLVVVNYSNDQINRHYLTDTVITGIDNNNFAVFQTDHFTTFSIGVYSGTFTINNDNISTTSTGVTLNMNVSGVTYMRFGNSIAERNSASWIGYQSTYPWTLSGGGGEKIVYAEFDDGTNKVTVEDTIILDIPPLLRNGLVTITGMNRQTITFPSSYTQIPVVIATPQTDNNGNNYPIPTIRNVTITGFEIAVCVDSGDVTCASNPLSEEIAYFVFDVPQANALDWIEVGTSSVATNGSNTNISFTSNFSNTPVLRTTTQTYNQNGNIAAVAWVNDNWTTSSATLIGCVHQDIANVCTSGQPNEVIGRVAIDTNNVDIDTFQNGMKDISNSSRTAIDFSPSYIRPRIMATQNDDDGAQDPQYPWVRNVLTTGSDIRYCEADGPNYCDSHNSEKVYRFAVEGYDISTLPTAQIEYSITGLTNQDVIATLTGFSKTGVTITNNGGSNTYTFTGNGSFTFTFQDLAGNTGEATATVTWIDKTKPSGDIYYSQTGLTNQNVIVTLTGFSKTGITITNNNGSPDYTFTGNGLFTFTFQDLVGNTGEATATVTWIDKISPTASISYSPDTYTTQDVIATLTGFSKTGITITNNNGSPNYTFTGNGSFTFEFQDIVGNTGETIATVTWIDKTKPTGDIHYSTTGSTTQDVIATLTGFSETGVTITNNGGSDIYTFTGNGSFTFEFQDLAGNTGETTATVTWIQSTSFHQIDDIILDPSLNISRFAPYTLITQTSGDILSGEVDLSILDGDNNSCRNYYTDGTCDSQTMNFPLISSANNTRVKTGIYPDYIYPEIFFAPSDITRNNTPIETTINRNNYHIFKMDNPFTMVDEMSFWIEFNAVPNNLNSSSDLYVYIASNDQSLSNFQTDWRNNPNVELVGTLNKNNTFHHTHTSDSSHHLVALSTNSDGTIGNKNINISGQFWIILYQDSPNTNRGWKLRYHDQSICTNTGSWYVSSAFATPISQSGCPDAHVHIARRNLNQDLLLADITMYYQDGENISQITGSNTFSFGEIPNMPPNQTSFINPLGLGVYNTAIDISWNPASDPNNDSLFYNLYLLSSTGTRLSTIVTGISTTGYLLDISTISDGAYGLELESCDSGLLCSQSYLDDNFFLDTSIPTIIFTGATPQDQSILTSNNFTTQLQIQDNLGLNQFSYIYDGTIYNIYDSGLLLMYNFDNISPLGENYTIAKDFSQYSNTGTIYGNPQHTSGVWNGSYSFDGSTNQYISIGDGVGIDIGTSHTISLRIKPNLLSGSVLGQMSGVSAIYISGSQIGYSNSPGNYTYFDVNMSSGQRNHIAISRDSTNISLYKNGLFVSTGILGDNIPLELFYIGKESDIGLNEKRFNGKIDELFIYNRSLSSGEISQIYRSNLSAVSDNKFIYTTDYSCIATGGIYYYSGIVYDNANNSNSLIQSNIINIPSPSLNIQASSIDMGQIQASMENSQTLSGQSVGNFSVSDWRGNTSWYTTISTPLNLIGNNDNSHVISGAQISFKSSGISTLSGFSTNLIYVVGNLSGYVNAPNAATYIKRDLPDIPFMCPGGVYGNKPWFKVEVPAGQAIDTYSGTITYDIVY
ncbi:LamG domain-containing protein [Candidatus Gracilibacteria bacterium]|nr:LamG domain-containing protein [Candidatus Gracilibacteria bacterium]